MPQALPGGEIYAAMERGVIAAAESIGPYDDGKLGLYKIAEHYYYPAFWEGSTEVCVVINTAAWDKLPKLYQDAAKNPAFKQLCEPWKKFRERRYEWFSIAELSFESFAVSGK